MNRRAELFERAAESYERAGLPADAGRCYAAAGLVLKAAQSFESAGDHEAAARAYRRCGAAEAAASLYLELGRPQDAVACHEEVGDLLSAGWVLALHTRRTAQARMLLTDAAPAAAAERLRRELGLALCTVRLGGDTGPLVAVLDRCAAGLASTEPPETRADLRDWAVQAADRAGRHDLAARMFAAAYQARAPKTVTHWRAWAAVTLGDTFGVPDRPLPEQD